jgi:hypothetical protein
MEYTYFWKVDITRTHARACAHTHISIPWIQNLGRMYTECGISHKTQNIHASKIHIFIKLKLPLNSYAFNRKLYCWHIIYKYNSFVCLYDSFCMSQFRQNIFEALYIEWWQDYKISPKYTPKYIVHTYNKPLHSVITYNVKLPQYSHLKCAMTQLGNWGGGGQGKSRVLLQRAPRRPG